MGKRGPKLKPRSRIKWSREFAYAVGLVATDGNLYRDGRHIDLTSKDIEQLKTFKRCLGLKTKISYKTSGSSDRIYPRLQFSDVKLYRLFLDIGLHPNKSKTIGELKIPSRYFFHFLRGCFDGDGSIYSYFDPRWVSSFMFYVTFTSASISYLEWLQRRTFLFLGVRGVIQKADSVWQLRYAKKESIKILAAMYDDKGSFFLRRKYDKVSDILKINARVVKPGKHASSRG